MATGRAIDLHDEWSPLFWQVSFVTLPMLLILIMKEKNIVSWLVCIFLTFLFQAIYLWSGIEAQRHGGGVDFGVAFLMLASPVLISVASIGVARLSKPKAAQNPARDPAGSR
jgi:hypothetical protein